MRPARVAASDGGLSGEGGPTATIACAFLLAVALIGAMLAPGLARGDGLSSARLVLRDGTTESASTPQSIYRFPSARRQLGTWAWNAVGPSAIGGNLVGASWRQWVTEEPSEWGDGWEGFGKRFGAGSLTTFVGETSLALGSAAMHQDPGYYRSPASGTWPRAWHAVRMTFLARTPDGRAVFSPAKTLSPFAGPLVTQTSVYPDRYDWEAVLTSGAFGLLITAGWNAAREFVVPTPPWGERPAAVASGAR